MISAHNIAVWSLWLIGGIAGLWLFFRFLYRPVLPFVVAWILAAVLQPIIRYLTKMTGWNRKLFAVVLVLAVTAGMAGLAVSLFNSLVYRAREAVSFLGAHMGDIQQAFTSWSQRLQRTLSGFSVVRGNSGDTESIAGEVLEAMQGFVGDLVSRLGDSLSERIPQWIAAAAGAIPSALLFLGITLVAAVYMACDYSELRLRFAGLLPRRIRGFAARVQSQCSETGRKYVGAYLLLLCLTFFELLCGFLILGIPYPAGLALLVSLVDILPVLGVGTVLLPFAGFSFLTGNLFLGIGLCILYAVIAIIRQIMEPRVVGGNIGLPPLLTLFSMYLGLKLFGVFGLIFVPIAVTILKELFFRKGNETTSPKPKDRSKKGEEKCQSSI